MSGCSHGASLLLSTRAVRNPPLLGEGLTATLHLCWTGTLSIESLLECVSRCTCPLCPCTLTANHNLQRPHQSCPPPRPRRPTGLALPLRPRKPTTTVDSYEELITALRFTLSYLKLYNKLCLTATSTLPLHAMVLGVEVTDAKKLNLGT